MSVTPILRSAATLLLLGSSVLLALGPDGRIGSTMTTPQLENGSFKAVLNGVPIHYEVHGSGPALMTFPNSWGLTWNGLRAL